MQSFENMKKQTFFQQHNERYRSVNFGEELIKEMIMCRSAAITIIHYFQSVSLKHDMKKLWFFNNERGLVERGGG